MKRLHHRSLALCLTLCLLVGALPMLSSCAALREDDVKTDPAAVLSEAVENTVRRFLTGGTGAPAVLEAATERGSLALSVTGTDLFDDRLGDRPGDRETTLNATLYTDRSRHRAVADAALLQGEKALSARVYLDRESIIAESDTLLGDGQLLRLDTASFSVNFPDSELAAALALDRETARKLGEAVDRCLAYTAEADTASRRVLADLLACMTADVRPETVTDMNGNERDGFVLSLTLDNDGLRRIADYFCNHLSDSFFDRAAANDAAYAVNQAYTELSARFHARLTVEISLVAKDSTVSCITLDGELEPRQAGVYEHKTLHSELTCRADRFELTVKLQSGLTVAGVDVSLRRTQADGETVYTLSAEGGLGSGLFATGLLSGRGTERLDIRMKHRPADGQWSLTVHVNDEKTVAVKGELTVKKARSVRLTLRELEAGDSQTPLDITLSAEVGTPFPKRPRKASTAVNVLGLTREEAQALIRQIKRSFAESDSTAYLIGTYAYTPPYADDRILLTFDLGTVTAEYLLYESRGTYRLGEDTIDITFPSGDNGLQFLAGHHTYEVGDGCIFIDGARYEAVN